MKIQVRKVIEKVAASGKQYFVQPVRLHQFPADDVTVWHRFYKPEHALAEGLFEADMYVVQYDYTDKTTGKAVSKQENRFRNLRSITE